MIRLFIVLFSIFFLLGCIIAYSISIDIFFVSLILLLVSFCIFFLHRNKIAIISIVCILSLLLGVARGNIHIQKSGDHILSKYTGEVEVKGVIKKDIEHSDKFSRYVVELGDLNNTDESGKSILIYEPYPTDCVFGESVNFSARLSEPEDFLTSTDRIFRYKRFLKQQGIYAIAFIEKSGCTGLTERKNIFSLIRKKFIETTHKILPTQEASLLGGLLLGIRGALSDELLELFRVTGLIHIIVLSGYNITIVAEAVRRLFVRFPKKVSLLASIFMIISFVILSGTQTAAVRAGSMATISIIARSMNREYDGVRALLFVGAMMALYNPAQVLFNISFHMSFIATLGLLVFAPIIERKLKMVTEKFQIRSIVSVTLATQIFLLPYLAFSIGEASIIGILANIIVLPLIPFTMAAGAIVVVVSAIFPFLANIISPIAYLPLYLIIQITNIFAIDNATVTLPEISAFSTIVLTFILVYFGMKYLKGDKGNQKLDLE